jgi:hypothetical protein
LVQDYATDLELEDAWQGKQGYTWCKGKAMSKIDRIYTKLNNYCVLTTKVDWTVVKSYHAAVIVQCQHLTRMLIRNEHVKLDNGVVTTLNELQMYLLIQLASATFMDPHMKLELPKMTVSTKALEIMHKTRQKVNCELKELNDNITSNTTALLSKYTGNDSQLILTQELESQTIQQDSILQEQGECLACLAKTRWYNEG